MSTLFVLLFFGGGDYGTLAIFKVFFNCNSFIATLLYDFFLAFKVILVTFIFVFIRANLPRFRFDQLMFIG